MKVTITRSVPRLIVFASALLSTIEVAGQGYAAGGANYSPLGHTSPFSPVSYGDPSYPQQGYYVYEDGHRDLDGVPLPSWRDAANSVLETTVGYAVSSPFGPRLSVDSIFGDRMGVDGNDYSIHGFLPWHIHPGRNLVFVVARGTSNDLGDFAGSFGIGQRMYFEDLNRIFGGSVWFDIDDTHSDTFHRGGGQIEYIGRYMEVRGGTDLIIDSNRNVTAEGFTDDPPFYGGNAIFFNAFADSEFAYNQGYIEAGGPLPLLGRYGINAYAGSYYLWHDDDEDALGWSARFFANLTRDVQVNARFTRDDVFGANTSVNVTMSLPNGGLKQLFRPSPTAIRGQSPDGYVKMASYEPNQRYQPRPTKVAYRLGSDVIREFRLPVLEKTVITPVRAINPTDGRPYCVIHVDPNASTAGDGTFERPFMTMETARLGNDAACDIIRVVPREDGTGMNLAVTAPFGLFNNQRLLGSSEMHTLVTTIGVVPLPGFTGPGPGPLVTNTMGGDVISVRDGNEVSGFIVDGGGTGNGIVGDPAGVNGFNFNRNTIQNGLNGINLANARGMGLIDENTVTNTANDGVALGVAMTNTLNLTVTSNTIDNNGTADVAGVNNGFRVAVGDTPSGTPGTLNATFRDNRVGGNLGHGIFVDSTESSSVTALLTSNFLGAHDTTSGNGIAGFNLTADSGMFAATIGGPNASDGNTATDNAVDGVSFDLSGTSVGFTNIQNNIFGTPITGMASLFDIVVNFAGGLTASQQATFTGAELRWESIIIGDVPDVGAIDDVEIMAEGVAIDGPGGILGQAGPTGLRAGSFLPFQGIMQFDTADLAALEASGQLQDVILHEMAHVLGFGTIWQSLGLLTGAGGPDPRFTGPQATAEFNTRFGMAVADIPVENTGGPGTADSHWRETVFNNELMTGFLNSGVPNPISRITVAQWADLGYVVNITQADPYIQQGESTTPTDVPLVDGLIQIADVPETEMVIAEVNKLASVNDPGIRITLTENAVLQPSTIDMNEVSGITGEGILIESANASMVDDIAITNNSVIGNTTGALLRTTAGGTINVRASSNTFDNNTGANTGFHALSDGAGSIINIMSLVNNSASNNPAGNGFRFEATGGGTVTIAGATGNTASRNGLNGAFLRADGAGSSITGGIGALGGPFNTFSDNFMAGMRIEATTNSTIAGPGGVGDFNVLAADVQTNGTDGVTITGTDSVINALFQQDMIAGNLGQGINSTADGGILDLTVGSMTPADGNTINANADAGISMTLLGAAVGEFVARNNMITNTVDDAASATPTFLGEGIRFETADTAMLNDSVIDVNTITGNASHGIAALVREMSEVNDLLVGNMDGDNDNANIITGNSGDGIHFERRDFGEVNNMDIFDNAIMTNANGLNLISQNENQVDTYDINDNIISVNSANGIRMRVVADADLDADIDNNFIDSNTGDGIDTSESLLTATDSRSVRGTWTNNVITNNMAHGVHMNAATSSLFVGTLANGNLIDMNGLDGIEINGAGTASLIDNVISNNGTGGVDFQGASFNSLSITSNLIRSNTGDGVELSNLDRPFSITVSLTNNTIDLNTEDGLEINNTGDGFMTITATSNTIDENLGRGVDILNQEDADSSMTFIGNSITSNELEGFYVVNTSSATQNQSDPSSMALAADGAIDAIPRLDLTLRNSTIAANGLGVTGFSATGLILRVGTSDGGRSFDDPGGFASDGRGGVIASVTDNLFSGNNGDDVFIESFVSTVDPAITGGAWDDQNDGNPANDVFTPTGYESDALARLDLTFTGNTGDSADVTRSGAFYDTNEPIFKSRTNAQTPAGPFTAGDRRRNAQRLAFRGINAFGDFSDPALVIGTSDTFLYPGVGGSTFRVSAGSSTAGFGAGDNFGTSVPFGAPVIFGELPFEWDTF